MSATLPEFAGRKRFRYFTTSGPGPGSFQLVFPPAPYFVTSIQESGIAIFWPGNMKP